MSFLTSEEATSLVSGLHGGLGQPWYNKSNVVAGMGGLLSMQELTSLKNYYVPPPQFPASGVGGVGNGAVPVSDLIPGELEAPGTLVATANRHHGRCRVGPPGLPVPTSDLARGELEHASQMLSTPQAFSGYQVPVSDFVPGELMRAAGGGKAIPVRDFVPGELVRGQSLTSHPQGFGTHASLMASLPQANRQSSVGPPGLPVPTSDLTSGELTHASQMLSLPQAFSGMGSRHGNYGRSVRAVPISDLVPGEYVTGATLVDHAQRFSGLGSSLQVGSSKAPSYHGQYGVPVSDLVRGELESAGQIVGQPQMFGLGSSLRLPNGQPGRYHGQYGVPISDLKRGEYERAAALIADRAQARLRQRNGRLPALAPRVPRA
jgi:hypothetical protein